MALAVLAGCGGNGASPGDQTLKVKFTQQVSFGDSLSDVGSYKVGTVAALGGGKFTINGDNTSINAALTGKNWTELMAAQFGLPAPCAAQTGLNGDAAKGLKVAVVTNANCYGYAQGGARVTNPVGPGNAATGSALGALTVPVVTQVANHLAASGGKFSGTEVVFVMAGANDLLFLVQVMGDTATATGAKAYVNYLVGALAATATNPATAAAAIGAAVATESARTGSTQTSITNVAIATSAAQPGNAATGTSAVYTPIITAATAAGTKAGTDYATAQAPVLVAAMATAASDLVTLVKNQIIGKGANYVVVNNIPDVANTPKGLSLDASTKALVSTMVSTFNTALNSGLGSESKALIVDVYAVSHDQATNPGPYGLTNVTEPACDLTSANNPLGSSLTCTAKSLKSGDVSHYSYADDLHPSPFNNLLLARYVAEKMVVRGWL
jgi:phospholipase/lecithinase/hemolysin